MEKIFLPKFFIIAAGIWLMLLACRVTDVLIAQGGPAATRTVTATRPRPTFTRAAQVIEEDPTATPIPSPTPRPPTRPPPTRTLTPRPAAPAPPPPTPDPYAGWYFKPVNKGCVTAGNTRIQGTVIDSGIKKNGVKVRVSNAEGGDPVIDDFITGIDPSDYKHVDPSLQGQYRLGIAEGKQVDGNWWIFILNEKDERISPGVYVKTIEGPGCNTATIDFVH